ncbi:hypothetical protein [Colwellia sp. Bg11-28]|uniref:hypothetical protein n=1 Tax=Colwellia sp. Bg11-28 TaxID=2058305 RepID=UPI000C336EF9|nr:hypothetical protein [Colwellia sp. Bg11-28]PKH87340.1 hypothetical protein CXF79_11735 [Colwellia sp. Bg11-28]
MESTFKEPVNECQPGSYKVNMDSEQTSSHEKTPPTPELTQLELIAQWRLNLQQLLKDLGFSSSENNLTDELKGLSSDIKDKLDYLNKTDCLLQEYDDFTLSDAGFEKYKSANLAIVRYLTQLHQEKKSKEKGDKNVKFYFFSRSKHIKQQVNTIPWLFALFHLVLLIVATLALTIGGIAVAVLSQMNGIVLIFLAAIVFTLIGIVKDKVKSYKISALTPFRFITSLLSICSLTTVLYALILIAAPAIIAWEFKPFWRDDVMIIGLGIFTFILFGHSVEAPEETAKLSSAEAIK